MTVPIKPYPTAATAASPCTSVCRMSTQHPWCEGCHRTLDEIAGWARMDAPARQTVWEQLPERRTRAALMQAKP
jgi:uncharacterized protein